MKQLKDRTVMQGDDLSCSYKIEGADGKTLSFCIRDDNEELYSHPMEKKEDDVYHVDCDSEAFSALDRGEYTYSVRIEEKPKITIAKGKLTIE